MTMRVALFRAVNLSGRSRLSMAELRDMAAALGLDNVATVLQTGNLIFADRRGDGELERLLEAATAERFALGTEIMVRTAADWAHIVDANPFKREARGTPVRLHLIALKDGPMAEAVRALRAAIRGRERIEPGDRVLYTVYPDGVGRSKLTSAVIERHLGTRGTGRNWNTVLRIDAALRAG